MSGRFSKLEPQVPSIVEAASSKPENPAAPGEPVRDAAFYFARAVEAMHDGKHESALQLYTRCLKEDRARIPAWVGQLQMLLELREDLEARLWSEKALEVFKGNGELLACRAQASLRVGDPASAMAQSDQSLAAPGSSPLRWIARGEVLMPGRSNVAAECFAKAKAEETADWYVPLRIARVYLRHDQPGPASEYAKQATSLSPSSAYAWITLAECHDRLGSRDRAAECFRHALQLAPQRRELKDRIDECERRGDSFLLSLWRRFRS